MMKKGTRQQAEALHGLVARKLQERLQAEDCTTADIKNAMEWLHRHGITKFIGEDPDTLISGVEASGVEGPDLPDMKLLTDEEEDVA